MRSSRIGYLSSLDQARDSTRFEAIRLGLREVGYIEGQNIAIEYRSARRKLDRYEEIAAELGCARCTVVRKLDLIRRIWSRQMEP